jgi:hypothetical protein
MTPRDMARFGYLMLNRGTWDGREIVSPEWVEESTTQYYQTPWGDGYGYQWWIQPAVQAYAATGHYEQKIYVVPHADLVAVFTANIADKDPHPTDAYLARYIVPACTDLPELDLVETYNKYGFTLEYPLGVQIVEAPIPGRDTVSAESGAVQFNTLYPPLEVVSVLWDQAAGDVDLGQQLAEVKGWLSQQPGLEYEWGETSQSTQGDHEMLLRFFHTTAEGHPFSGLMGIWHCPQANRIYMFNYAVTPEATAEDLVAAFHQYLEDLSCHGKD